MRKLFELIRPEIQQYFIKTETAGAPLPREIRSVVYQRAKQSTDTLPFGTQRNVYAEGYEIPLAHPSDFKMASANFFKKPRPLSSAA